MTDYRGEVALLFSDRARRSLERSNFLVDDNAPDLLDLAARDVCRDIIVKGAQDVVDPSPKRAVICFPGSFEQR